MLTLNITTADSIVFESGIAAIATFSCSSSDPLFRDSGPIGNPLFVFPRSVVTIRHNEGPAFVSDPNVIPLFNRNQLFSRTRLSSTCGDTSDWYAVHDDMLLEAIAAYDPRVFDRPERPFPLTYVPARSQLYFEQRQLVEGLSAGEAVDRLAVEESILHLLDQVVRQVYGRTIYNVEAHRKMVERAEAARLAIASDIARNVGLSELAREADCSPFALCRAFHTVTQTTATDYRHSLRLRSALDRLRDTDDDLTAIALDLGYSSHSHFTMHFRRAFGLTPSSYRSRKFLPARRWESAG